MTRAARPALAVLRRFARDEAGSTTIWSIFWTIIFLILAGFAIDTANAYRFKAALRSTADGSALAGAMAYFDEQYYSRFTGDTTTRTPEVRARAAAQQLAQINMAVTRNGDVLPTANVVPGNWDPSTKTFTAGSADVNAVRVTAVRTAENSNPLDTLLLGAFTNVRSWDIGASAVVESYFATCPSGEGLLAAGDLFLNSGNRFEGGLCLHGDIDVRLQNNNEFAANAAGTKPSVSFGPAGRGLCHGSGAPNCSRDNPWSNVTVYQSAALPLTPDMVVPDATYMPDVVRMFDDAELVLQDPSAYVGAGERLNRYIPSALVTNPGRDVLWEAATMVAPALPAAGDLPSGASAAIVNGVVRVAVSAGNFESWVNGRSGVQALPANMIYDVDINTDGTGTCSTPNDRIRLTSDAMLDDIVLYTSCRVQFNGGTSFDNSHLLTTYESSSRTSVSGSAGTTIGDGTCDNPNRGSKIFAAGSMMFASGLELRHSQIVARGDIDAAAQTNAVEGALILSGGDIHATSNGQFRGCANGVDTRHIVQNSYRIVN